MMKPILQRLLLAYQPLRQRGLLLDGRPSFVTAPATTHRQRATLTALTGLRPVFRPRSQP